MKVSPFSINFKLALVAALVFSMSLLNAQSIQKERINQLGFLVGEWIGQSTSYKDGKAVKTVPAFEKINFGLDGHILTIDLDSEALQLHTVIYYDEKDDTFYYNPFYKKGAAKYKAEFKDDQLIVWPSKAKRFVFGINDKGEFVEYGETLINGKWIIYFKDVFTRTQ